MSSQQQPAITEKAFQQQIVELALATGHMVYHTYDSRRSAPGFPDLVLVKGKKMLFLEVKSAKGRLSRWQAEWIDALRDVTKVRAHIVYPEDWNMIEFSLTGKEA